MRNVVVLGTNLLVLFVVGLASMAYIPMHERLQGFAEAEYDALIHAIPAVGK